MVSEEEAMEELAEWAFGVLTRKWAVWNLGDVYQSMAAHSTARAEREARGYGQPQPGASVTITGPERGHPRPAGAAHAAASAAGDAYVCGEARLKEFPSNAERRRMWASSAAPAHAQAEAQLQAQAEAQAQAHGQRGKPELEACPAPSSSAGASAGIGGSGPDPNANPLPNVYVPPVDFSKAFNGSPLLQFIQGFARLLSELLGALERRLWDAACARVHAQLQADLEAEGAAAGGADAFPPRANAAVTNRVTDVPGSASMGAEAKESGAGSEEDCFGACPRLLNRDVLVFVPSLSEIVDRDQDGAGRDDPESRPLLLLPSDRGE